MRIKVGVCLFRFGRICGVGFRWCKTLVKNTLARSMRERGRFFIKPSWLGLAPP
ncbi:MAG: hypothetical protein ACK5IQ_10095 [Bacteroidales bacterium]